MTDELKGRQVGGYQVHDLIGRGGMAVVYSAHQLSVNRTVALKVLPRHFLNDDTYLQRFNREVNIVSQLEHRNIVPVYDYGQHEGQPYIVMRFMSGGSVDDILSDGPLPVDQIIRILEQIAPALDYAHGKSVLHRDLKPSNVLMDDDGGAYLTDFGIARILSDTGAQITTQGVVGTPSYMSPEQAQGQPLDGRSDLYSLGVMLFEMATGRRPFESDTPYSIAVMQVTTPPPSPRSLNDAISHAVEQVILTALRKRREDRYPTAVALVDALRRAASVPYVPLSDTQPGAPRPAYTPEPEPLPAPASVHMTPPPPPPSRPVTRTESVVGLPRARKRPRTNVWISAVIGIVIGCGLLTLLVILGFVIVNGTDRQEAFLRQTATADGVLTEIALTLGDTNLSGGTEAAANNTPMRDDDLPPVNTRAASSESDDATSSPEPTVPTETPFNGVAPIGVRPTETLSPLDVTGALVFFAERGGNFNIFRMELPARTERQLTVQPLADTYPIVSPDGTRIAFQSDRDGDFDIYVMDVSGNETRRVVQNSVTDRIPAWSPDGAWLVFSSDTRNDGNFDLFRVRPDGSDLEQLVSNGARNSHPRWSADSRSIVFTSGVFDDATTWEIARYDLDTGVTTFLTNNTIKDWSPTFSPDGSRVLYLTTGDGYAAIAEVNLNGEEYQVIYDGAGYESSAAYSPDGQHIVFTSNVTGEDELYLWTDGRAAVQPLTDRGGLYAQWVP